MCPTLRYSPVTACLFQSRREGWFDISASAPIMHAILCLSTTFVRTSYTSYRPILTSSAVFKCLSVPHTDCNRGECRNIPLHGKPCHRRLLGPDSDLDVSTHIFKGHCTVASAARLDRLACVDYGTGLIPLSNLRALLACAVGPSVSSFNQLPNRQLNCDG